MSKSSKLVIFSLFLSSFAIFTVFLHFTRQIPTKIVACDIGQGDAIIIEHGQFTILIDSGPNQAILNCLSREVSPMRKIIDVAIATHYDSDHIGGFASVLQNYEVHQFFINPTPSGTQTATNLAHQIPPETKINPLPGDELILPGLRLKFLWSEAAAKVASRGSPEVSTNETSLGVQVIGKSFGFLGMGDLECSQELAVTSMPLLTPYQILKVSHHGAKTSSCLEFLEQDQPEVALISVGEGNKYGHPTPETLDNLRKIGAFVLRTDLQGQIELTKTEKGWLLKRG